MKELKDYLTLRLCSTENEILTQVREKKISKEVAACKMWQSIYFVWKCDSIGWDDMIKFFGRFCSEMFDCRVD